MHLSILDYLIFNEILFIEICTEEKKFFFTHIEKHFKKVFMMKRVEFP
jgi:hypothetical protein